MPYLTLPPVREIFFLEFFSLYFPLLVHNWLNKLNNYKIILHSSSSRLLQQNTVAFDTMQLIGLLFDRIQRYDWIWYCPSRKVHTCKDDHWGSITWPALSLHSATAQIKFARVLLQSRIDIYHGCCDNRFNSFACQWCSYSWKLCSQFIWKTNHVMILDDLWLCLLLVTLRR